VLAKIEAFSVRQTAAMAEILSTEFESRKALAEVVTKTECPACLFAMFDGKANSAREWLLSRPATTILKYIGKGSIDNVQGRERCFFRETGNFI
jgi:hypothetical protein